MKPKFFLLQLVLTFSGFLFMTEAMSQKTESEIINVLTSDSYKNWIQEETVSIMNGDSCKTGLVWKFYKKNRKLEVKACKNGVWVTTKQNWEIEKKGEFDWQLIVEEKKYNLTVRELEEYDKITLRYNQGELTTEIPLYYIKE